MGYNNQNPIEYNKKSLKEIINNISDREAINLHFELLNHYPDVSISTHNNFSKDSLINLYCTKENIVTLVENCLLNVRQNLIHENEFDWLKKSKRVQITCLELLKKMPSYQSQRNFYGNDTFDQFQSSIDSLIIVNYQSSSQLQPQPFQPQPFQPQPFQPQPFQPQPFQPQPVPFQPVEPQLVQPQPVPFQPVEPQLVQPQPVQPQPVQPQPVQPQPVPNQMPSLIHDKIKVLEEIKSLYNQIHELDNYSKWLEANNKTQIEWTKEYLKASGFYISKTIGIEDISIIKDTVLSSLDLIGYTPYIDERATYTLPLEKKLFIDKMKRAWSQKKYRDAGKTKTPYHLPLTKIARARLEKLAEIKGLSTTTLLDVLINSAYERDCIGEDGNELY